MTHDKTDPDMASFPGLELEDPSQNQRLAETSVIHRFSARLFFAWYDVWIGAYWDQKNRLLYICPVPMIGVRITVPRSPTRRLRSRLRFVKRPWVFVPALVAVGVAVGVDLGIVLSRSVPQPAPAMTFSPLPGSASTSQIVSSAQGIANVTESASPHAEAPHSVVSASASASSMKQISAPGLQIVPANPYPVRSDIPARRE